MKIFDIHTHIYPEKVAAKAAENFQSFYECKLECTGLLGDLEERSENSGVKGFLLLTVATKPANLSKINDYAAESVRAARERGFEAAAFGGMHQNMTDTEKEKELDRMAELGLSGVKLHPDMQEINLDDRALYPLYEMLCARDLPVTFHMGDKLPRRCCSGPDRLLRVMNDFPRLRVIAAHFGGYMMWDEAVRTLAGREGLMFDSSSSFVYMNPGRAKEIIGTLGAENIMFGTDYPCLDVADELKRFFAIDLTEKERERILYGNAAEFLRL